jgi:hypothetical protein
MRVIAKLKLTKPNVAEEIAFAGKMRAVFGANNEMTTSLDWYAVYEDAKDPFTVVMEAKLACAHNFIEAIRKEKHFDCLYKFFDIVHKGAVKPLLNYIEQMVLLDDDVAYCIPECYLTLPSAEDACVDVNAEIECGNDEIFDMKLVAIWIRRNDQQTDIVLPIYPRILYATSMDTVELTADTYDDSNERLTPDIYRPVLDVIDYLTEMSEPCQMLAIDASACCGDEINISEKVYPINRLCLCFNRHGKAYSIVLNSDGTLK